MMILRMSTGEMSALSKWKTTKGSVAETSVKNPSQSHGRLCVHFIVNPHTFVYMQLLHCMQPPLIAMYMYMYICVFYFFREKHPVMVHVWAGISRHGRTHICIFEGIMDRYCCVDILRATLLPFIQVVYSTS